MGLFWTSIGDTRKIEKRCGICKGSGMSHANSDDASCWNCYKTPGWEKVTERYAKCYICEGKGKREDGQRCSRCDGKGALWE